MNRTPVSYSCRFVLLFGSILFFQQVYLFNKPITILHTITYEEILLRRIFREIPWRSVVYRRRLATEGHGNSRKRTRTRSIRCSMVHAYSSRATEYSRQFAFIRGSHLFRFLHIQFARICVNLRFNSFGCGQRLL